MEEKIITCIQCGRSFVFTVSEQKDFIKRGFAKPKRCPACRKNKHKTIDSQGTEKHNGKKKYLRRRRKYETLLTRTIGSFSKESRPKTEPLTKHQIEKRNLTDKRSATHRLQELYFAAMPPLNAYIFF